MSLAPFFADQGLAGDDAASRAGLVHAVTEEFTTLTGHAPPWRWFAPGRLEIFGKHTDYAGGSSLLAAVPRGFAMAAGPRDDGRLRAVDVRRGARAEIDASPGAPTLSGWASYLQVTARRLAANFPGAALGLDLVFCSDLPPAAGLSSSSALVVGAATALATRASLPDRDDWLANIASLEDRATYFGCIESGQGFAGLPGARGVGTHGGSEDHTAILGCRAHAVSLFRFVPAARVADIPWPRPWTFVVATSGVHADKAGAVRDRFNRMSAAARALVALWNTATRARAVSLAGVVGDQGALADLRRLASESALDGFSSAELQARLEHFVAEDALAHEAASAVAHLDAARLGEVAVRSQQFAETRLGNQVPETAALAALARECGAYGATSFGAGFGGSVWALVDSPNAGEFASAWMAAYGRRCPHRPDATWFAARPGPGLVAIPPGLDAPDLVPPASAV